jgi:hypothetical protein
MKKVIVFAVVALFMLTATAFAAAGAGDAHMNTGCGLGTMLFKNNGDNSTLIQTFQATTNGIFGNQTFGITTGTSECKHPSQFASNERMNEFVLANMDNLAKDIAMGKGETLDAFAELMGVPVEKRPEFAAKLQSSFGKIYTSDHVVMANVMDNIATVSAK